MAIDEDGILRDTAELVAARGPCGEEDEVAAVCRRKLDGICDEVRLDAAGNLVGLIRGGSREPGIKVMAHMDELSFCVKRIDGDGMLRVRPLGGITPQRFGDGPVEVLADGGQVIPGVIGFGPRHTAEGDSREPGPGWENARVNTRLSGEELEGRGVHPGTRVIIAQNRRELFRFADCVGSYFLDDRACIAVMLAAGEELREGGPPPCDVHLICTRLEEVNGGAAAYAAANVPGEIVVAIEVMAAAAEYDIPLDAVPVIVAADARGVYTTSVCRALAGAAEAAGTGYRHATLERFASDASCSMHVGNAAQIGCIGFPTDNTHGFEVCLPGGLVNCARLLAEYLKAGGATRPA